MHSLTVPPAEQALKEPALRLFGDPTALGFQVLVARDVHWSLGFVLTMSLNVLTVLPWTLTGSGAGAST